MRDHSEEREAKARSISEARENNNYVPKMGDAVQIVRAAVKDGGLSAPAPFRGSEGIIIKDKNPFSNKGRALAEVLVSPDPYHKKDLISYRTTSLIDAKDLEPINSDKLNKVIAGVSSLMEAAQNKRDLTHQQVVEYKGIPKAPTYTPRRGRGGKGMGR